MSSYCGTGSYVARFLVMLNAVNQAWDGGVVVVELQTHVIVIESVHHRAARCVDH